MGKNPVWYCRLGTVASINNQIQVLEVKMVLAFCSQGSVRWDLCMYARSAVVGLCGQCQPG